MTGSIYLFIYLMKLTFIMILSFFPYRTYFLPAKTFNRTLHLHQTFQRFLPYSPRTDESGGIKGGILFTICPCAEHYFGKTKMASSTHPCSHAFCRSKIMTVMLLTPCRSIFPYRLELWPQFRCSNF